MRKVKLLLIGLFFAAVASFAATHVAVLETVSEKGVIGRSEKMFLTDNLRERAKTILPAYMGYVIMTRENINAMLPPGKTIEDCEGSCLAETGRNIAADYVAQARVGKFGKQFTLTMELYETAGNNLVGSFTARKPDAEGLLEEIEREADRIFRLILGSAAPSPGGKEGISGLNMGEGNYQANGQKNYIVRIETNPAGSMFSVDSRVDANCSKAPCDITLPAGKHRFTFSKDLYFDKDIIVEIKQNGQKVSVSLAPNFGELVLAPIFDGGMGSLADAKVTVDGKDMHDKTLRLPVGEHKVQIAHKCYEKVSFDVGIKIGSKIRFDKKIQPILGGLELDARIAGTPKKMPVYINDKKVGETPLLETVPVCADIKIGKGKDNVPVKLVEKKTVKYTYKGLGKLKDPRDGKTYNIVEIGNQIWMAENINYETEGSWCFVNSRENCSILGRLYWWAVAKEVCPSGWHLPSKSEFQTLFKAIGGKNQAGKKLKAKKGWVDKNVGLDEFGFTALPGGYMDYEGLFPTFYNEGTNANYWSSSERNSKNAYYMYLGADYNYASIDDYSKYSAFSVRCVKD